MRKGIGPLLTLKVRFSKMFISSHLETPKGRALRKGTSAYELYKTKKEP